MELDPGRQQYGACTRCYLPCQTHRVASVGRVDLELDDPDVVAGAVFLTTPERLGASSWEAEPVALVPVANHRVRVIGDQAAFVSLLTGRFGAEDTMVTCFELAQRALDLEAAHGELPLSLRRADEQHIFWWRDAAQIMLRIVITRPLLVSSRASAGHVRRYFQSTTGTGLLPKWGRGLRFFRLSQLSTDVFDAYRNAFLALEALLDEAIPPGAPAGEYNWLKFALTHVPPQYGVELQHCLVGPPGSDPVTQFLDEQYHARRCALFHAKSTKGATLLPGAADDRRDVSAALEPLVRFVVGLIRGVHNIIFPAGGMVVGGFTDVIRNLRTYGYKIAVLNDPEPTAVRRRDDLDALGFSQLSTSHVGALDAVGLEHGFRAETTRAAITGGVFNTVVTYTATPTPEGILGMPWAPTGLLSRTVLPTVDPGPVVVQLLIRWVLDNLTMPRSRFVL
jgi:hypothetical protein